MPDAPPIRALEQAREYLGAYGYPRDWSRRGYEIPLDRNGAGKWPVDYVLFCDTGTALISSALTIQRREGDPAGLVSGKLSRTNAPFHVIVDVEQSTFEFWAALGSNEQVGARQIISERPLSDMGTELEPFARDLAPATIRQVKAGKGSFSHLAFRDLRPLQLGLFVEDATAQLLTAHFSYILNLLRAEQTGQTEAMTSRTAIELLAARILADAGVLTAGQGLESTVAEAQQQNLGRYFNALAGQDQSGVVAAAFNGLASVSFKTFTPDMLRSLYPAAFPLKTRRLLGRYDTPLSLTQRILDNLPLETLPPARRQIADMTCGWGSFLVAAHHRLAALPDGPATELNQFIVGNDIEPNTANLASLSLLLASNHDSWRIDHADALQWDWLRRNQPGVIVGNPPFRAPQEHHRGEDMAYRFVAHAVDRLAEGGLLAMVVPASLRIKPAANDLRRKLFTQCDVWEIWEVPGELFTDAKVQPIVIFARKIHRGGQGATVIRRAGDSPQEQRALEAGRFTRSALISDNTRWLERRQATAGGVAEALPWTPLILSEERWAALAARRVGQVAKVVNGMILGAKERRYDKYLFDKQVRLLTDTRSALPSSGGYYVDTSTAVTVNHPSDFAEPGMGTKDVLFARSKVVMTATMRPQWGEMARVGVDHSGIFVSNSFHVAVPEEKVECEEGMDAEALAAVLRWRVVNAWICEHRDYPWIRQSVLKEAPFPPRQERAFWTGVSRQVRALRRLAAQGRWDEGREREIDQMLVDAYGLGAYPQDLAMLETIYRWRERVAAGDCLLDPPPAPEPNAPLLVAGKVESVDAPARTLTAWIDALAEAVELPITPAVPGWLLREGACFEATLLRREEGRNWGLGSRYELAAVTGEAYAYLEVEEARRLLAGRLEPSPAPNP